MSLPEHILVIRLSAPGDVAMTVPVLQSFQKKYPAVQLTVLTNKKLAPLFTGLQAQLFFAETKTEHRGFGGLLKLFKQLNTATAGKPFDGVADLHNVLRSQVIRSLYRLKGVKTASIDKGRAGKKALTRKQNKKLQPLPTSFERYRNVFRELGYGFEFDFRSIFQQRPALTENIKAITGEKEGRWIGIAPFAAYREKMFPPEKMESVISKLLTLPGLKIVLFGSNADTTALGEWAAKYKAVVNAAGKLSLGEELIIMSWLDCMVSMDSANMHFASLVNTRVVSVWGATHPFAGFLGWDQSMDDTVQVDLFCRPCSVFGNKPCYRGDWACMNLIEPARIIEKIIR